MLRAPGGFDVPPSRTGLEVSGKQLLQRIGNSSALADFAIRALHNSARFSRQVLAIPGSSTKLFLDVAIARFGGPSSNEPGRAAGLVCTDALTMRISDGSAMKRLQQ